MIDQKKRILVLGNGPSLKGADFAEFDGVDAIGMNAAYRFWGRIGWFPTYYACLDSQVVISHADAIVSMIRANRFKRLFLHWHILKIYPDLAEDSRVSFLCQLTDFPDDIHRCASLKLQHQPSRFFVQSMRADWITTGSGAIRFCAHMGYREIGIIGIDCNYQEIIPEATPQGGLVLRIDKKVSNNPNYFFDDYQQPGDIYHVPNPSILDGNLHRTAISTIATDNVNFEYGLSISILTKESWLYEAKIFPYQELQAFLNKS